MDKSSYTDEEMQEILQVLFQEKKMSKEQEESLRQNTSEINQLRLKLMHAHQKSPSLFPRNVAPSSKIHDSRDEYRERFEEAQQTIKEQKEDLTEAKQEIASLHNQVAKLKELLKGEKSPTHSSQMEETFKQLSDVQEQCSRHKQRAEKLASLVLEREKKIAELQQFEYGFRKSNEQKQEIAASIEKQNELLELIKNEKENVLKELEEAKQHSLQLERVINFLRERQEEARLENMQFQEEFQVLRQTVTALSDQLKLGREEFNKLEKQLQLEQEDKQEAFDEVAALQAQFESLKKTIWQKNKEIELFESHQKESEKIYETLKAEKEDLDYLVKEKSQRLEGIVKELDAIKELLTYHLNESKEAENKAQLLIEEKKENEKKVHALEEQLHFYQEERRLLKEQLDAALERENFTSHQLEVLEQVVDSKHKLQEEHEILKDSLLDLTTRFEETLKSKEELETQLLQQKEQSDFHVQNLKELNKHLEALKAEKEGVKENLAHAHSSLEDAENRFKVAQQHLAKKVKENAELNQKLQDKEALLQEIQTALNQARMKNAEIQSSLDLQHLQEKRLQEQLQESIRSAEALATKWEGKYFAISEKWQESESKVRELSKLEERYHQLQSLLANLGTVLGTPVNYLTPSNPIQPTENPSKSIQMEPTPQKVVEDFQKEVTPLIEKEVSYQDLFDMPKAQQRPKSSLFD